MATKLNISSKRLHKIKRRFSMKNYLLAVPVALLLLIPGMAAALEVGDKAPGFTAVSQQGPISLQQYLGLKNVVLAFYFADYSPV